MGCLKIAIADDNENMLRALGQVINGESDMNLVGTATNGKDTYDIIHFLRREMLDFTAFPVIFVSNLLLVQRKKYYFNRATVSRNCSIVL